MSVKLDRNQETLMEGSRSALEIVGDLSHSSPEEIGGAVLALPDEDLTTLRRELLPSRDELQAHIDSVVDDPDLGTA